jgi:Siphovirus Gp157
MSTRELRREAEAAHLLIATLRDIGSADDETLVADSIEGETNFIEAIDRTLANVAEDIAHCVALKEHIDTVGKRLERIQHRIDMTKVAVMTAMSFAEQRKLVRPLATLSIRPLPSGVIVHAEADIPAQFWKPQDPKLDKRAIGEALKAGTLVPGADLSNGGETLSWSFK